MISGVHHITAIAGDPVRNVGFYRDVLGLRLVKRTVNFDDPGTYHLYFGDRLGRPGTILTFFPWPGARRGVRGVGQATAAALSVPRGSLEFWRARFVNEGILHGDVEHRFAETVLEFFDPDGLALELVADAESNDEPGWEVEDIPAHAAIRGVHGVTLQARDAVATGRFLTEMLGFSLVDEAENRQRFGLPGDEPGRTLDVVADREGGYGSIAAGSIHHVAWRVANDASQLEWRRQLTAVGLGVSPVMDRQYFRSIYFHEPGGVLFEIATDPPGFSLDEEPDALGTELQLPPWLESERASIASRLPDLEASSRPAPAEAR